MVTFRTAIQQKIEDAFHEYETTSKRDLKQFVLAELISFNKKRDREVSAVLRKDLTLQMHLSATRSLLNEMDNMSMTPFEKKIAEAHILVRLPGKAGKMVPVMMTENTRRLVKKLLDDPLLQKDVFFFQSEGGTGYYRGAAVLNRFANEFKLEDVPRFR